MDRIALFGIVFIGLLLGLNGALRTPLTAARKGYNPLVGAAIGALAGLAGALLPGLLLLGAGASGGLAVLVSLAGGIAALVLLWNRLPDRDRDQGSLPLGDALRRNIRARHITGAIIRTLYRLSVAAALLSLAVLLGTILNKAVGLTAVQYSVEPHELVLDGAPTGRPLSDLEEPELAGVLAENMMPAKLRVLILSAIVEAPQANWATLSPQPVSVVLAERQYPPELADVPLNKLDAGQSAALLELNLSRQTLEEMVFAEIVKPEVVQGWPLLESLLQRDQIDQTVATKYPNAELKWRSWVNWEFISGALDPRTPDATGIRPALLGSLLIIVITIAVAFPIGVGAAIYLEEYAGDNRLNRLIQTNISNLAGVPSIIYGMLGLAIFVRSMEAFTSGRAVGASTANGRTVLSAGLTLALLILPLIIINAQEALRAVPSSLRHASYGLGATQWQTIWHHVLPYAMPGILTGTILAISRAIGETAPLILVGGATFLTQDPHGPFSIFTALPLLIYRWTTLPQAEFRYAAAAAIVVLLALLLTLNSLAVLLRIRFSRRLS